MQHGVILMPKRFDFVAIGEDNVDFVQRLRHLC